MNTVLRVATWICLFLPLLLLQGALVGPPIVRVILLCTFGFVVLIYASVWFVFRPTRFEVDTFGLRIVWPTRLRLVPAAAILDARVMSSAEFRRAYGWGIRIGAGGLWGGFGLLKTAKETFSMWISRTDVMVVVRVRDAKPLLITPEQPRRFVESIRQLVENRW